MSARLHIVIATIALGTWGACTPVGAQVILLDRRAGVPVARSYEITEVAVDGQVRDQVAEVRVSQTFHNPGSQVLEAEFLFPLPEDGAIESLTLLADGQELTGRLLSKEEARAIYEEIVRRKRDPALLEYMGRGLYRTSVFPIPPGAERKVTLRYTQLLPRDGDVVEFGFPFATQKFTAKPIGRLDMRLRIASRLPIKSLYSPGHEVEIERQGDREATVRITRRDVVPTADFRLLYTLAEGEFGTTILSYRPRAGDDGYFMLLASPKVEVEIDRPLRSKTVIFVLDRSGSMTGKKIEQARESLRFVLENLREGDLFNIVVYDDRVEMFRPELERFSADSRRDALRFVENLRPGGSTNIEAALTEALGLLPADSQPGYVLFLTDGLPTVGERSETAIAELARKANEAKARLFCFGVGDDVNARLLDRLSRQNAGTSEYVRPDEDIEAHVARFFAKMTRPALTNISIEVSGTHLNRTYPRDLPDLFEGGQLVWVGRYRDSGEARIRIIGRVGEDRQTFTTHAHLAGSGEGKRYAFVERLWAVRRVGDILDQIDLHGENSELTAELVELSKAHGIMTPYTSFLAEETTNLHAATENRGLAEERLSLLREESGAVGVGQRLAKQTYQLADQAASGFAVSAAPRELSAADRRADGTRLAGPSAGVRGGFGMMGGMMGMSPRAAAPGLAVARDFEGREVAIETVRSLGAKTFYRRGDHWVDAEVTPDDEAQATVIEQYSDAFFNLARTQERENTQYLSIDEPLTIKLDGRVYRIVPPSP